MIKNFVQWAYAALSVLLPAGALAAEGGTSPGGGEGYFAGFLPSTGKFGILYLNHYSADRFNDSAGNSAIPGFHVETNSVILRYLHMTGDRVLDGDFGWTVLAPLTDVHVEASGRSDNRSALGNVAVSPGIAWHANTWHWIVAPEFILPTGAYDKARLANTGDNHVTLRQALSISYLPPVGLDASVKLVYSYSFKNHATDYQNGQYWHANYNLGWRFDEHWQAGVAGYYLRQFTDDRKAGVVVPGARDQVFSIGPAVRWHGDWLSVELKWLQESHAEHRPQGTNAWTKLVWKF